MTERDRRVTFRTTRGEFTIPAELLADGMEDELGYYFATHMPPGARSAGRTLDKDGNAIVRWRKIRVVELT